MGQQHRPGDVPQAGQERTRRRRRRGGRPGGAGIGGGGEPGAGQVQPLRRLGGQERHHRLRGLGPAQDLGRFLEEAPAGEPLAVDQPVHRLLEARAQGMGQGGDRQRRQDGHGGAGGGLGATHGHGDAAEGEDGPEVAGDQERRQQGVAHAGAQDVVDVEQAVAQDGEADGDWQGSEEQRGLGQREQPHPLPGELGEGVPADADHGAHQQRQKDPLELGAGQRRLGMPVAAGERRAGGHEQDGGDDGLPLRPELRQVGAEGDGQGQGVEGHGWPAGWPQGGGSGRT